MAFNYLFCRRVINLNLYFTISIRKGLLIRNFSVNKKDIQSQEGRSVVIRIIGNGAQGNPRGVLLSIDRNTDKKMFLFNCSEGMQRLIFQNQ